MKNIARASLKDLLRYAVRSEIDSNQAYSDLAKKLSNPLLKEKFQWLAYEENKHKQTVEKLFHSLFQGEKLQVPEEPAAELLKKIEVTPSSTLVDILKQAMDSEKSAETFYASLAEKVKNIHKKVLNYLSKVEHSHYMMLEGELSLALEFEDYAEQPIDKVVT
ncbi:MAG: ferritin-like domain-containing protein [Candidatus Aminicenantes bacterium]